MSYKREGEYSRGFVCVLVKKGGKVWAYLGLDGCFMKTKVKGELLVP